MRETICNAACTCKIDNTNVVSGTRYVLLIMHDEMYIILLQGKLNELAWGFERYITPHTAIVREFV